MSGRRVKIIARVHPSVRGDGAQPLTNLQETQPCLEPLRISVAGIGRRRGLARLGGILWLVRSLGRRRWQYGHWRADASNPHVYFNGSSLWLSAYLNWPLRFILAVVRAHGTVGLCTLALLL